jgi:Ca2+/Na+ antiporter
MTIIAMGNALPDALTTIALSKEGYAIMGMTGAYAGQLFGLLVGLGLSVLKLSLTSTSAEMNNNF